MKKMSSEELCKALKAIMESYKEITPDNKEEGKHIKFGVDVMKQAIRAIKQGEQAIELLKGYAFYCIDLSVKEHCDEAVKVQEFLKNTFAKNWLEEQLKRMKCNVCEIPDCPNCDSNCANCEENPCDEGMAE